MLAREQKFDLTIPTEDEKPGKKFQLQRRGFAIACHTNMTSKIRLQVNLTMTNVLLS